MLPDFYSKFAHKYRISSNKRPHLLPLSPRHLFNVEALRGGAY